MIADLTHPCFIIAVLYWLGGDESAVVRVIICEVDELVHSQARFPEAFLNILGMLPVNHNTATDGTARSLHLRNHIRGKESCCGKRPGPAKAEARGAGEPFQ